jgi:hypothetical protein
MSAMSFSSVRATVHEVIALARNRRHAAILRRHLRVKYGAALVGKPGSVIGDALAAIDSARWKGLAVFVVLLFVALRR